MTHLARLLEPGVFAPEQAAKLRRAYTDALDALGVPDEASGARSAIADVVLFLATSEPDLSAEEIAARVVEWHQDNLRTL